jgi:hypothetical protein
VSKQFAAGANRRFQFHKRGQFFVRMHNELLSVVPMRISYPERSPVGINTLRRSPNSQPRLLRLRAIISQYFTLRLSR